MTEAELRELLAEYLTLIGRHPSAEEFMAAVLTDDFETGFEGGYSWRGLDGLRDFLSQREGFFDEKHTIKDVLAMEEPSDGECSRRPTRVSTAEEAPPGRGLPKRIDERRAQLNAYSS